jgi:hypothetical protein
MQNNQNKPVTDWTLADFTQHEANLDYYERALSGYIRGGLTDANEIVKATQRVVQKYRADRTAFFKHFGIEPVL